MADYDYYRRERTLADRAHEYGFIHVPLVHRMVHCPKCFAMVPEWKNSDGTIPWMEHILWHEHIEPKQWNGWDWSWRYFNTDDKQKLWELGEAKRKYQMEVDPTTAMERE